MLLRLNTSTTRSAISSGHGSLGDCRPGKLSQRDERHVRNANQTIVQFRDMRLHRNSRHPDSCVSENEWISAARTVASRDSSHPTGFSTRTPSTNSNTPPGFRYIGDSRSRCVAGSGPRLHAYSVRRNASQTGQASPAASPMFPVGVSDSLMTSSGRGGHRHRSGSQFAPIAATVLSLRLLLLAASTGCRSRTVA